MLAVFYCILLCILLHLALRFVAYRSAFCRILQCILLLISVRFGAKRRVFWCKSHTIGYYLHIHTTSNGMTTITSPAPFCTKTNLRENRKFATGWAIGD